MSGLMMLIAVVLFSRNIGQVTPEIINFHYLKKTNLDHSIQKTFYLILKREALVDSTTHGFLSPLIGLLHHER